VHTVNSYYFAHVLGSQQGFGSKGIILLTFHLNQRRHQCQALMAQVFYLILNIKKNKPLKSKSNVETYRSVSLLPISRYTGGKRLTSSDNIHARLSKPS